MLVFTTNSEFRLIMEGMLEIRPNGHGEFAIAFMASWDATELVKPDGLVAMTVEAIHAIVPPREGTHWSIVEMERSQCAHFDAIEVRLLMAEASGPPVPCPVREFLGHPPFNPRGVRSIWPRSFNFSCIDVTDGLPASLLAELRANAAESGNNVGGPVGTALGVTSVESVTHGVGSDHVEITGRYMVITAFGPAAVRATFRVGPGSRVGFYSPAGKEHWGIVAEDGKTVINIDPPIDPAELANSTIGAMPPGDMPVIRGVDPVSKTIKVD